MLKLMLLKEVDGLGNPGDIVRVRPGYARNFLFPRRLAAPISADAMRQAEAHKKRLAAQAAKRAEEARAQAEVLSSVSVSVEALAKEDGSLYGSVTATMIANAVNKEGVAIEPHHVVLEEPLKSLGIYDISVRLFEGVETSIKVYVVAPPPSAG